MLRTSTNAASPAFAEIIIAAELMVTITYCSGFPMAEATTLEREERSAFCFPSESGTEISSFNKGILFVPRCDAPFPCQIKRYCQSIRWVGRDIAEWRKFAGDAGQTRLRWFIQEFADRLKQFGQIERLLHQGPYTRGQGGEELIRTRRHDDDWEQRVIASQGLERLPSILDRHTQIQHDQIDGFGSDHLQGVLSIFRQQRDIILCNQNAGEGLQHCQVIVHQEYFLLLCHMAGAAAPSRAGLPERSGPEAPFSNSR